jgi:hypothetical protein
LKAHNTVIIAVAALVMLVISIPSADAQINPFEFNHSAGIVTLETEEINFKIVGVSDYPHFQWWDPDNPDLDYHMRFVSLFEANDTNVDGVYTKGIDSVIGSRFMLPFTNWDFSGFVTETDGENITAVHFNFTSTTAFDPRPEGFGDWSFLPIISEFDVMTQIRVHFDMDNPSEVKFDVVIDGWVWSYDDSILVFQFVIVQSLHGDGNPEVLPEGFHKTGTKFEFSNGYMEYEGTALAANNTLQVEASYGEGVGLELGESVYLAFEYFGDATMIYDPILGIEPTSSQLLDTTTTLLLVGGIVVVVIAAIVILKVRK